MGVSRLLLPRELTDRLRLAARVFFKLRFVQRIPFVVRIASEVLCKALAKMLVSKVVQPSQPQADNILFEISSGYASHRLEICRHRLIKGNSRLTRQVEPLEMMTSMLDERWMSQFLGSHSNASSFVLPT